MVVLDELALSGTNKVDRREFLRRAENLPFSSTEC
jgi:hypothetical protein